MANSLDNFCVNRSVELLEFVDLVSKYLLADKHLDSQFDLSGIHSAASQFRISKGPMWSYKITDVQFPNIMLSDSGLRHHRPQSTAEYQILLSVEAHGLCLEEDKFDDPICDLKVDIIVIGRTETGEEITSGWHLDSQPGRGDRERSMNPIPTIASTPFVSSRVNHTHPRYHFQAGGNKVWEKRDEEFGSQLLLSSPRIAHPPLEVMLAVDFVLSNYYGHSWEALRKNESRYRELVAGAQARYWRPYYMAVANMWDATRPVAWSPYSILPNIPQDNF